MNRHNSYVMEYEITSKSAHKEENKEKIDQKQNYENRFCSFYYVKDTLTHESIKFMNLTALNSLVMKSNMHFRIDIRPIFLHQKRVLLPLFGL
ncbi:hypothetical protein BpHYR1_045297 [Brachionus plicatilis]|uniref:Uncharacterized protein n=1 Tax=Brachionus plicatilis TaxID=10195 RepID=A0A3M7SN08_BRAPC|nr:hypothetical protein BpHYR1_045297 [Brachionus plicatilis]